jgi:hypothetical protein
MARRCHTSKGITIFFSNDMQENIVQLNEKN